MFFSGLLVYFVVDMVKIQSPKEGQFSITLPLAVMKFKRWKKGTELLPMVDDKGDVVLKEIQQETLVKGSGQRNSKI